MSDSDAPEVALVGGWRFVMWVGGMVQEPRCAGCGEVVEGVHVHK